MKATVEQHREDQGLQSEMIQGLQQIQQQANAFHQSVMQALSGLQSLDLGIEKKEGAEFGLIFPREVVTDAGQLSKELHRINIYLQILHRLFIGKTPEPIQIRSLSSTDLSVFFDIGLNLAQPILEYILDWSVELFLSVEKIRKIRDQVEETDDVDGTEIVLNLQKQIDNKIDTAVAEKVKELMGLNKDNTLENSGVSKAVAQFNYYVSADVSVEISVSGEGEEAVDKVMEHVAQIGPKLRQLRTISKPHFLPPPEPILQIIPPTEKEGSTLTETQKQKEN